MHDVTVSVWNRFWSFPLIEGLNGAGFDVLALGSTRRTAPAARAQTCWSAALLTQATYHLPAFKDRFIECALNRYERFAAQRARESRCLWGWSGHHLAAFQQAKAAGIPVILETGSTHARWASRVLDREYPQTTGCDRPAIRADRLYKMVAEYEIADAICVPSSFVARTFISEGVPAEKIHVNPFGADMDFWRQRSSTALASDRSRCVFVYCGQIMLRKGIRYLLEAWRQLGTAKAELWLIGHPEPACEPLMRNLPGNVRHFGEKSHHEIRDIYAQCDAYVLPSLEEGLARSTLEAMAAGLPLIVTAETGVTDVMVDGEDGWVVPHSNSGALADVLNAIIADPAKAARRGQSAARRVEPYTWEAYGLRAGQFLKAFVAKT